MASAEDARRERTMRNNKRGFVFQPRPFEWPGESGGPSSVLRSSRSPIEESHLQHTGDKQHVWYLTGKQNEESTINRETKVRGDETMGVGRCTHLQREPRCHHYPQVAANPNLVIPSIFLVWPNSLPDISLPNGRVMVKSQGDMVMSPMSPIVRRHRQLGKKYSPPVSMAAEPVSDPSRNYINMSGFCP